MRWGGGEVGDGGGGCMSLDIAFHRHNLNTYMETLVLYTCIEGNHNGPHHRGQSGVKEI